MVQGKSKDLIDHHQVKSWKYWSVSQYPSWSSILPPVLRLCHRLWCFMTARWWGSCIFKQECIKMKKIFICTIQKTISVPCGLWKAIEASLGIHLCLSHKHGACNLIVFLHHVCLLCALSASVPHHHKQYTPSVQSSYHGYSSQVLRLTCSWKNKWVGEPD